MHRHVKDLDPAKGYTGVLQRAQDALVLVRVLTRENAQVNRRSPLRSSSQVPKIAEANC